MLDQPAELDRPRPLAQRTFDDIAALLGAATASFAAVWVLYTRVFATEGLLGFIVCWYFGYLAIYGLLTATSHTRVEVVDRLLAAVVFGAAAIVGVALLTTVGFVFVKGWPALHHWNFYVQDMGGVRPTAPLTQGGIRHAVVGSAIEVTIAVCLALPLGIATAVYLTEVGGRLSHAVRTVVEAMTALPDVLAGLFVYTVLIINLHWERAGIAAAIALAVTMVPVIARSAEVVLRVVPSGLREASFALGVSKWQTVRGVVLPTARSGLATSLILGVARITGETAPLLIVSGASTFFNTDPLHNPMNSLPLFIFSAVRSGEPEYIARGYGAGALLVTLVLVLFAATRVLARTRLEKR
ncbi:MAG: phosphate transport system permease protein [Actinomycetota bacterium]